MSQPSTIMPDDSPRRISSLRTWVHKRAFPFLWFGFLGMFSAFWIPAAIAQPKRSTAFLPVALMATMGYVVMRLFVFDLMDEVWLDGDEVLVRNRGKEERFPITNIVNVDDTQFVNPERITLTLREPCQFGAELAFTPPQRWWPFGKHKIAKELIRRAHGLERA
jgi:hypothetical protein